MIDKKRRKQKSTIQSHLAQVVSNQVCSIENAIVKGIAKKHTYIMHFSTDLKKLTFPRWSVLLFTSYIISPSLSFRWCITTFSMITSSMFAAPTILMSATYFKNQNGDSRYHLSSYLEQSSVSKKYENALSKRENSTSLWINKIILIAIENWQN